MTQYDNTNRGTLFRNQNRQTDKHPSHQGSLNIEGKEYYLDAWVNESKNGTKYFSLRVKAKEPSQSRPATEADLPPTDYDQDVPF